MTAAGGTRPRRCVAQIGNGMARRLPGLPPGQPVWNSILRTHSPHTLPHTYAHTFFTGVGVVSPVVRLECRERRLHTLHTFAVGPPRRPVRGILFLSSVFKKKYEKYAMYAPLAVGPPQGTLSPYLVAHFFVPAEKVCT